MEEPDHFLCLEFGWATGEAVNDLDVGRHVTGLPGQPASALKELQRERVFPFPQQNVS